MRTALLLRQTRMHFPRLDVDQIKIRPIEKGGSDRKFYRIHSAADQRLILVKYNLEREENRHYVQIAKSQNTSQLSQEFWFTVIFNRKTSLFEAGRLT